MKIIMVCLGNICRSPLAEGIMKTKVKENNLDWIVESAGTGSWHIGKLPDSRSIDVANNHGLDITDQRARQFNASDLDTYDLIFAMDASNYQDITRLANNNSQKEKIHMIMNMATPGMNQGVPDPYWGNDGFENVYQMLDLACEKVIEKYKTT